MARGKTTTVTVSPDGCTITLHHRIYFHDADLFNPKFARQVADAQARIQKTWQPAGGFHCGDCTILFEFEFLGADDGALRDDVDGKHIFGTRGVSHQSALGPERRPGCWFSDDEHLPEAAHEVGHEMGMTDKYRFVQVDPAAPTDQTRWQPVDDPRGIGRGSQPTLPPNVHSVPKDGYPDTGLAFRTGGTPQEADLKEILAANGVECKCNKPAASAPAPGTAPAPSPSPSPPPPTPTEHPAHGPTQRAEERRGNGKRAISLKTGFATAQAPLSLQSPILPPWTNTAVPEPPENDDDGGGDGPDDDGGDRPPIHGHDREEDPDDQPLVFVPGIMGSMLRARGRTVWPPDAWNFRAQMQAMLDPALGKDATGLTPGVYEPLIRFIERARKQGGLGRKRPTTYEIFPYDWTSSCRSTGRALKDFIDRWLRQLNMDRKEAGLKPFRKVDVIAHSFGGLLTRIAVKAGAPIDRQVFLGTPHEGAPKAHFTLHPDISYADSLGVVRDFAIKVLLWWNKNHLPNVPTREELLWKIAMATESAWELLPDTRHLHDGPHFSVDGTDQGTWQAVYLGEPVHGAWAFAPVWDATISDAMALKDALGKAPGGNFRNIIADRHDTPKHIDYTTASTSFGPVVQAKPGDGTVLAVSAAAGGSIFVVLSAHAEIPSDAQAHKEIRAYLG